LYIIKINLKIYKKILKLFKYKNASDFRKEKLILNYSRTLFLVSLKIIAILISVLLFIMILNEIFNLYLNFIISVLGIIEFSIVFVIYHLARKRFYAKL
tara:strand:- start:935 stop:1231 length:297 start_codon:yes stop_codon:yes gene_type:complete